MTAADRPAGADGGSHGSLRHSVVDIPPLAALVALLVLIQIVAGFRALGYPWQGGDLLYHSALANAVLRGEIPPGGPYAGLPAYYPPGFHVMLAATMGVLGLSAASANQLLTVLWIPLLPIGTFLLARRLTGRPWVAILATALTAFAGGFDLQAGRLWVNSLFMGGQEAYPLFPRDVVFAILPFALLLVIRALEAGPIRRAIGWAAASGVLFGLCGLVQIQLLLPLPFALVAGALCLARLEPERRWRSVAVVLVAGTVAALIVAPWLLTELALIRRNGGVALDSSDSLTPARFGIWSYPREFGVVLPLGIAGAGLVLLRLRRPAGPRIGSGPGRWGVPGASTWTIRIAGLVLVAWSALAFVLGVFYSPAWPLEDALRPQRMWLLASQPMTILAAMGLVVIAEDLAARIHRPTSLVPLVVAGCLVATVPATVATSRLLAITWTTATYADLDLRSDRVPDFSSLLDHRGPRTTVLTYEDWGSLAWFQTGCWTVAIVPSGFAKLAYDPLVFTGRSQATRRDDLLTAFDGDPADFDRIATAYDANTAVISRGPNGGLGIVDVSAVSAAARPGAITGTATTVPNNGWDAIGLEAGARLALPVATTEPLDLFIRLATYPPGPTPARRFELLATSGSGDRVVETLVAPATAALWQILEAHVRLAAGEKLMLSARDDIVVQSIRGFAPALPDASPINGWGVVKSTPLAVVLGRAP
ncbi:MAG TPA: hypothetical protein VK656_05285 [Candidatus Acidoferrum sp.]|nr:hypothetical protein [Candidatus Acidoferrum sp.]